MTVERPVDRGEVWMVNATMGDVGFYVNHHTRSADVDALKIGPELQVNGDDTRPYGVYSISARWKDRPDLPALAAASVDVEPTHWRSVSVHTLCIEQVVSMLITSSRARGIHSASAPIRRSMSLASPASRAP